MPRVSALPGKVVAVTGGARGIGREIAAQLATAGARVALGDLGEQARATAAQLPGQVRGYELDVADSASFRRFLDAAEADFGPVDVLVNNAGTMWVGPFADEPDAATDRMLSVNLGGVIRGVRAAAPAMRLRGRGHIITIASAASRLAPPGESTYAATKHGVLGYLTGVREELRGSRVQISVIMPGVVDTDLAAGTTTGAAKLLQPVDVARAVVETIERPRFEVSLPAYVGPLTRLAGALPQFARDRVLRALVPDQVAAVSGSTARTRYESQTFHTVPTDSPVSTDTTVSTDDTVSPDDNDAPAEGARR